MTRLYGAWSRAGLHDFAPVRTASAFRLPAAISRSLLLDNRVLLGLELEPVWTPLPQAAELPGLHDTHVAFLGRIDNRSDLLARYQLPSSTPDEVIALHAYHERRLDAPALLAGEWAFALYDARHDRVLLARDPVGTIPLYFAHQGDAVLFASDIDALLQYPGFQTSPDEHALAEITVGAARLAPTQTFFRKVSALPPGEAMVVDARGASRKQFWDFQPRETGIRTLDEAAEEFRAMLQRAVARRMRTAASVAVQLSGGLDSSAIYCLASEVSRSEGRSRPKPLSYSASDGGAADERRFIAQVDEQTGLQTAYVELTPIEFMERAAHFVEWAEAPFLSHTPGAFARLVEAARRGGVQVVLNGGFGDQVTFPFPPGHFVNLFRSLRWSALWQQQRMIERWQTDVQPNALRRQTIRLLLRAHTPTWLRELRRRVRNPRPGAHLFGPRMQIKLQSGAKLKAVGSHLPQHARPLYETVRSPYKVRALEAATKQAAGLGVALTFPFLDRDLLQLLISLPPELQYADGTPRALLRRGLANVVPQAILARREKGDYTTPVRSDIVRSAPAMLRELDDGLLLRRGVLDATAWRTHRSNWSRANVDLAVDAFYLGDLYGLELWFRRFH
jgi:asparagine synthase (glutamine-hydrolysing)